MTDVNALVDGYIEMWNETDAARRRTLVDRTWTEDAEYVDPLAAGHGHDGIDAVIAGVQGQFPGFRFSLVAAPDTHNDRVRFTWELAPPGSDAVATGFDFGTIAPDGRLRSVTGFLELAQAA